MCRLLEQGGLLAQARWEIDLLTKAFGPALMQMEPNEREQDLRCIEHVTRRYFPTAGPGGRTYLWNLPVLLSFGKVLPELLTGDVRPVRMRTQVLVWNLARKASYTFPSFRAQSSHGR
jgi:hypothetical protein